LLGEKRTGRAAKPAQLRVALHEGAFVSHNRQAVEMLVQAGAPLGAVHGFRSYPSALSGAALAGFGDIIPDLLEVCVEPLGPHGDSETPTPLEHAIKANQPDIVRMLLDAGHRLVDDGGLCVIAAQGNQVLMDMFLDRGFDVEMCWQGALFAAVMHGQVDMVELLIARGTNPHLTHEVWMWSFELCRYSTIGFAVQFRHLETLKLLLRRGVIPETRDLELAWDERFDDAVALLKTYSFDNVPEKQHIAQFRDEKIRERHAADLEVCNLEILTPLEDPQFTAERDPLRDPAGCCPVCTRNMDQTPPGTSRILVS
jgi:hypothetical protein